MSRKYSDFVEGVVIVQNAKCPPYNEERYVPIACPYCKIVFVEIKERDLKTTKASKCLTHIRKCPEYDGEVAPKRSTVSIHNTITQTNIQTELEELKAKVSKLERKTNLYDDVLAAVMPSLQLPLQAPEQQAQITLREAAIKDITSDKAGEESLISFQSPVNSLNTNDMHEAVPKSVHMGMLATKEMQLKVKEYEMEVKDEKLSFYQHQIDVKETELAKAIQEKEKADENWAKAEREKHDANEREKLAIQTATSASSRADKLQKERDALQAKFNTELRAKEQLLTFQGRHSKNLLIMTPKRKFPEVN